MPKRSVDAPVVQEADVVESNVVAPSKDELSNEPVWDVHSTDIVQGDVVPGFAISLDESARRIKLLRQFVQEQMVEGEDYGKIPGTSGKPTLFKPGAEKLNAIFGLAPIVEVSSRLEDWDKGFVAYEIKVTLINKRTREIESEGIGSCNSRERKYVKQDAANMANTILKMAKKRALVDATLSAVRASGLFTQDVEDLAANGALNNSGYSRPTGGSNGAPPRQAAASQDRPWNPAWRSKIGPCAEQKDENGSVLVQGKTLDEMSKNELRWYYDKALEGADKDGPYAAQDKSKAAYILEIAPDILDYDPVEYQRSGFRRR
jgi:hypothetical protein